MKVLEYRGFGIDLNTETGEFTSISDYYDAQHKSGSLSSAKKTLTITSKKTASLSRFLR